MVRETTDSVGVCHICGAEMNNDPQSLRLNCGGDCRLCMAKAGDPDCLDSVIHILKEACLQNMTARFKHFEKHVAELNGDTELFAMQILEQWRPW